MRKLFALCASAMILLVGSTFAQAAKPRQAPPAMTEQEIKDYIDAQVDKVVKERMPLAFSTRAGSSAATVMACPAGASCPAGCTDNGDGTCSCPAGTACGMSQYGDGGDDDGGGSCANGSCGKAGSRRHLLGRIFDRRRGK